MPMSEAKKQANKKWNDANMKDKYDRIQIVVPKEYKETIEQAAALVGERSVSKYIVDAIRERIAKEGNAARGCGVLPVDSTEE